MSDRVVRTTKKSLTTGKVWRQSWRKGTQFHRGGDKPADVWLYADGTPHIEMYYREGKEHRDGDKPSLVAYHPNGRIHIQAYSRDGAFYREGGKPTAVTYDDQGTLVSEKFVRGTRVDLLG